MNRLEQAVLEDVRLQRNVAVAIAKRLAFQLRCTLRLIDPETSGLPVRDWVQNLDRAEAELRDLAPEQES